MVNLLGHVMTYLNYSCHFHKPYFFLEIQIKQSAKENHFESASGIVNRVRRDNGWDELALGDFNNLVRITNRAREKERPSHPKTKDFEVSVRCYMGIVNFKSIPFGLFFGLTFGSD